MESAATVEAFVDDAADPNIRGFLHLPAQPNHDGLVLTHGAGGNARGALLVALAEAFCGAGFAVLRCDLPYRQRRPWGPPGPADAARDRAGLQNAVVALRRRVSGRIFLGGHSYGGRQASMLCAEQPELAAGLLLSSYPLHPPGKPEQQRTQHFPHLRIPTLFVHGTRDPFASTAELEPAIRLIPTKTRLLEIDGAGHDLGFKAKSTNSALPAQVLKAFRALL